MKRTRLIAIREGRYGALLGLLVLILLLYAFVDDHVFMRYALDLSTVVLLALSLRAIASRRAVFIIVLVLGLLSVSSGAIGGSIAVESVFPFGAALRAAFLGSLVATIGADIARRERITMDTVFAACCVYLLVGLAWGALYSLAEWIEPGSFENLENARTTGRAAGGRATESELVYFSLITMTTVGYGDIVPSEPPVRTLAAVEALMAQLFLAIVIARFVALEITSRDRDPSSAG